MVSPVARETAPELFSEKQVPALRRPSARRQLQQPSLGEAVCSKRASDADTSAFLCLIGAD